MFCACIDSCPCLGLSLNLSLNLTATLTAVKCNCYCVMQSAYQRDAPQPPCCRCCCPLPPLCCSSATAVLHKCNWWGLYNHWVKLHSCTLPVLLLKTAPLAWLGLKSSNFLCPLCLELASLGYLGLGTLNKYSMKTQQIVQIHLMFMYFPLC